MNTTTIDHDHDTTPADLARRDVEIICRECSKPFILGFPMLAKFVKVCPACSEVRVKAEFKADVARAGQRKEIDVAGWHRLCPDDFREIDLAKHPRADRHAEVLRWKFGAEGLVLHGKTGRGKTRSLYALLRREFHAGRTIAVCDHTSGLQYAAAYNAGPDAARAWFDHRCKVDILAMDDVFKVKLTDSFEQVLFQIVSFRTERRKPILFTTNDVGVTLENRMSPDRGPALIRRMRDYCKAISF